MIEIWKDIKGYEGYYQVSNMGDVRSVDRVIEYLRCGKIQKNLKKGRILTPIDRDKYLGICLAKNGKRKSYLIHRLVAETFLANPNNLPQVNHKDEDKFNNCVDNLEWCTAEYNDNYGERNTKISKALKEYANGY